MARYFECPMKCGLKFISKEHAERHANKEHPDWLTPKQKGWATPHGFIDFTVPITYEEACQRAAKLHALHGGTNV